MDAVEQVTKEKVALIKARSTPPTCRPHRFPIVSLRPFEVRVTIEHWKRKEMLLTNCK